MSLTGHAERGRESASEPATGLLDQNGSGRVKVDGRFFRLNGQPFPFRGVTYGTFMPREDGALFPERPRLEDDLEAIAEAGFTVVRTYTPPTDDLLKGAASFDLRVLAGVFFPDWRYLLGASKRQVRAVMTEARRTVREQTIRFADSDEVLALCLGNEIPADVLRWFGTDTVADAIESLVDTVRAADPGRLVTYANYPTAEYLPLPSLDFLTFNVFLETNTEFRRYLTRLQNLAGDRPLVLGEVGLAVTDDEGADQRQADFLDWQLETALERGVAGTCVFAWTDEWAVGGQPVEGWRFGLTRADRSPRPALEIARRWNRMEVADLHDDWPSMSVVICAYNAESTLDECLVHTCALDYPDLEIIVVDDGSTDATAQIARRHPRAKLLTIDHAGLSAARNEGYKAASGRIVAYLDSDAYPSPKWPYYLALAFDSPNVGGVGGPNVAPPDDPIGAHRVARAPGGPVHVLVSDDRAEHVPGCNMAFWRDVLIEIGGFDPIYTSAGDDVDFCWKVLDRGMEIGFHPAALVWHHRRPGLRAYLRQQRGYGQSEALVEARHPDRFTPTGTARWRGRIYNPAINSVASQRIYRGPFGAAPYQSVYQAGGHGTDLAYQVGVPMAVLALPTAVLGLVTPWLAVPAAAAIILLLGLFALGALSCELPRGLDRGRVAFRASVALHRVLQPLVRAWGRSRSRASALADTRRPRALQGPVSNLGRSTLVLPADRPREEVAASIMEHLRVAGLRVLPPTGWEDYDTRIIGSTLVTGDLVTSGHPVGSVQVRVRRRLRWQRALAVAAVVALVALAHAVAAAVVATIAGAAAARGIYRTGPLLRRTIRGAATS